MIRNRFMHLTLAALAAYGALGCESGGVGAPCIPEDEYKQDFSGFALQEVNVESRSFQCETRVCLVNHFQGRVSCPYGQADPESSPAPTTARDRCRIPGSDGNTCVDGMSGDLADCNDGASVNVDEIREPVEPQLIFRNAEDTVYCSCRCKGPDENAVYCECPSGFECQELVRDIGVPGRGQLVGNYCIKPGTAYDPTDTIQPYTCNIPDGDANKSYNDGHGKSRKVGDTCGRKDGQASNPPI
jgi:hypothetical protein